MIKSSCLKIGIALLISQVVLTGARAQTPAAGSPPALSRLTQSFVENGHKACSKDLDKAVKWVHEDDTRYGMHYVWNKDIPDKRTAIGITSESLGDGTSMVTAFTSTLDSTNKCSISAVSVFYFPKSCTSVRESAFKGWKFGGEIASTSVYESDDGSINGYLTSTPGGCQVVRKYIAYY